MKNKLFVLFTILSVFLCAAQKTVTWKDLGNVKFEKKYFPLYDNYFLHPTFSKEIKALEGQTISITGFFLDVDPEGKIYILSLGPMSSCFFCGVGGPETAIELHFNDKPKFQMDDIITVTGKLELNSEDVEHFNYIIKNCKAKIAE